MSFRRGLSVVAMLVGASGVWALAPFDDPFPHLDHEGLFPLCEGCHRGIETGIEEDVYPDPATCTQCHDGDREKRVEWATASRRPSNLVFSHREHQESVQQAGDSTECGTCHQYPSEKDRMAVTPAGAEACLTCHAHDAPDHLSYERNCLACHDPVWQATDLTATRLGDFPEPDGHSALEFISEHGDLGGIARSVCATCHSRESCERCHVNASSLPEIADLGRDTRILESVRDKPPEYPEPTDHERSGWEWSHSARALDDTGGCANCHTQSSCTACHRDVAIPEVASLPVSVPDGPSGVQLETESIRVHRIGFETDHGARAATDERSCSGCHEPTTCVACHDGPTRPEFHVGNVLEMHASDAYSNATDCASCHSTEVFCRGCHIGVGLASQGRLDVAFHNSRPFWLLGHGEAARQGLEGCVTCHSQVDCAQCHSARGGWRVSPHGPGFDGDRAEAANRGACLLCHFGGVEP